MPPTFRTDPKFNLEIVETEVKWILSTHIYMTDLFNRIGILLLYLAWRIKYRTIENCEKMHKKML